jgi:Amt family ammonium transporter
VTLAGAATAVIVAAVRALSGLRVTIADEITGVDLTEHGEAAYHGGSPGELAGAQGLLGESVLIATKDVRQPVRGVA